MFVKDFKEFISRGNVIDLAVAVVMGAAFTGIVQSAVHDIVTPILGIFLGGINLNSLSVTVGHAVIKYGLFIQAIINFIIIALVIFIIVKAINKFERHILHTEETKPSYTTELKVLLEIRDLLKNK